MGGLPEFRVVDCRPCHVGEDLAGEDFGAELILTGRIGKTGDTRLETMALEDFGRTRVATADEGAIAKAGQVLRDGGLVAFPTETVYGLGADATQGRAVAAIFATKGRPRFNPLIVHVADMAGVERMAVMTPLAKILAAAFWPGPLTLVLGRRETSGLSDLVSAGLDTVAIRVPGHPVAQALLAAARVPIAAPSANRSGRVSPTRAEHVAADLGGDVDLVLDGGASTVGLESTIVDCTGAMVLLLRPGAVAAEDIERATGQRIERQSASELTPTSPGQLASHYAPAARVRLKVARPEPGEALLAFGPNVPAHDGPVLNLSEPGDLQEAAANLFGSLRDLDQPGISAIAVMPIPNSGLGEAINDRLTRAAAPRS